ncbi:MAG TPA: ArsA-related P-loop ATPase, partial [Myxococcaceae bacterium]|nr:ArsA-related P-loop ATPase [Myxococcaceae bacterium]
MSPSALATALAQKRVLLCVGSGGVGKTTSAAALALAAAESGRSAVVCTIDPARRLANALGLRELGNTEQAVPEENFRRAGLAMRAPLFAMMLDMKQTWDAFLEGSLPPEQ